jgi:hypothetical protein
MTPIDILIFGALGVLAGIPLIASVVTHFTPLLAARLGKPVTPQPAMWKTAWVDKLLELQADLEGKPEHDEAVKLTRQLIWLLIGGEPKP